LLIYLEPDVQKKVISMFHFALNEGGLLMLGPSETVRRQKRAQTRSGAQHPGHARNQ
jgi:chemotaxis methyl-accepting protein methylase